MKHILEYLFVSGSENSSDDNNFTFETYSGNNDIHSHNEPLREEDDDYELDEYGNLLDKYK